VWAQIVLPIVIGAAALLVAPLAAWATAMDGGGDVSRWAAISTMWLLIPVMIVALILIVAVSALAYLTSIITGWIPAYSYRVQRIAARAEGGTRRAAEMIRKPVLAVRAAGDMVRRRVRQLRERR
jgi:predicted PurR-regulated permease PerM